MTPTTPTRLTLLDFRDRFAGGLIIVLTLAGFALASRASQPPAAAAAPAEQPAPMIVVTATPPLPQTTTPAPTRDDRAPGAALAAATVAPPTATAAPESAPIVAGGSAESAGNEKTWVSPDSYTLPGSKIVYYVDSSGRVVDQRLPGSEAWLRNAPAEQPTPAPAPPPAAPSNYCPRCGWRPHK